ncbi:unnamed protein product [Meganyctiphanes norvegica]|uniref:C2H2-type domain-containing protein n=1 Tax=Meganyctiphanes norvegica TaxID=48144 RepID=A0AAV2QJY2_MEGNR
MWLQGVKHNISSLPVATDMASSEEILFKAISLGIMKNSGDWYRCEVCSKSLNATSQAIQHVIGEPHKKKQRQHPEYNHLILPSLSTPSLNTSNVSSASASYMDISSENTLQESIKCGLVTITNAEGQQYYKCNVCDKTMTGNIPMKQHIISETHMKKLRKRPEYNHLALHSIAAPSPNTSNVSSISVSQLNASLKRINISLNAEPTSTSNLNPYPKVSLIIPNESMDNGNADEIIQNGIENGMVTISNADGQQYYKCNVCEKSCSGNIPMKQHITSEPHMKKLRCSPYKENSPPNASSTSGSSASRDLFNANQASGQTLNQLSVDISDILIIRAHEPLDNIFSDFTAENQSKNSK